MNRQDDAAEGASVGRAPLDQRTGVGRAPLDQPVHLHVDAHQQRTDLRAAFADWKTGNATRFWKGYDA